MKKLIFFTFLCLSFPTVWCSPYGLLQYLRWPDAKIPYQLVGNIPSAFKTNLEKSMQRYQELGINFILVEANSVGTSPKKASPFLLTISYHVEDKSDVSHWSFSYRDKILDSGREKQLTERFDRIKFASHALHDERVIMHELGHAVGLVHEHARLGRDLNDTDVRVNLDKIDPSFREAFLLPKNKSIDPKINPFGVPLFQQYIRTLDSMKLDLASVMLYSTDDCKKFFNKGFGKYFDEAPLSQGDVLDKSSWCLYRIDERGDATKVVKSKSPDLSLADKKIICAIYQTKQCRAQNLILPPKN